MEIMISVITSMVQYTIFFLLGVLNLLIANGNLGAGLRKQKKAFEAIAFWVMMDDDG